MHPRSDVPLPRDFADVELLLLGGTSFLGRHAAGIALERGHEVILFHCRSGAEGPYQVEEHLHGDRDGGLSVLEARGTRSSTPAATFRASYSVGGSPFGGEH